MELIDDAYDVEHRARLLAEEKKVIHIDIVWNVDYIV